MKLTEEYLMDLVRLCDACYDLCGLVASEYKLIRVPMCEQIPVLAERFPDMSKDEIAERLTKERKLAAETVHEAYDRVDGLLGKTGVIIPGLNWEALLDYLKHN